MFENKYKLILASSSERRLLLLKRIGYIPNIIDAPEIDESFHKNEKPDLYVKRIAREKAEEISKKHKNSYIIAADTVIFCGAKIYGKAFSESDAFTILKKLSGRRHRVYGAICVISPNKNISVKVIITQVSFKVISDIEIQDYISEGEWKGKAGCYAIQGIASKFIKKINGNYDNVVGLSLIDADKMLKGIKP